MAPICWSSKKLERVTKTLVFIEAANIGVLIAVMLQEIFRQLRLPEVLCTTDNASPVETLKSLNLVNDQHLRVDVARVKEMMARKESQTE